MSLAALAAACGVLAGIAIDRLRRRRRTPTSAHPYAAESDLRASDTVPYGPFLCGGLLVPPRLLEAIPAEGRLHLDPSRTRRALVASAPQPALFGLQGMVEVNRWWHGEPNSAFRGHPSTSHPPGNLDPSSSLLIGQLEPDTPIALDFRDPHAPVVVIMAGSAGSPWVAVPQSLDDLLDELTV